MAREHMNGEFGEQDQRTLDAFDRDLRAMLSVEPSSAFRAGVRQRIEGASTRSSWLGWYWRPALATAVVLLVAGVVAVWWMDGGHDQPQVVTAPRPSPVNGPHERVPGIVGEVVQAAPARRDEPRVVQPIRGEQGTPELHVIVDSRQAEAIRRLLDIAGRAGPDARVELPPETPSTETAILVPPVVVESLAVPELKVENKGVER